MNRYSLFDLPKGHSAMVKKYTISFREATTPIIEHVTKFGGQPVWLTKSQWPLSRTTGHPMRFICQIALDAEVFGKLAGRIAYLFMTDEEESVDGTWEPDSGENALIIQPGNYTLPTQPLLTGPTLFTWAKVPNSKRMASVPCVFAVDLTPGEDTEVFQREEAAERWGEHKIGGTPAFLQYPEYPAGGPWLLLQLDSAGAPFHVNFGDAGIGYAFISEDGNTGNFTKGNDLWACALMSGRILSDPSAFL
jgi:hypothetical protein